MKSEDVLKFWFEDTPAEKRFAKDPALDAVIKQRFGDAIEAAMRGELSAWRETAEGRLAEIVLLDQFTRNVFRDSGKSFAGDALALKLAKEAIRVGAAKALPPERKAFLYMPFMHSENIDDQETAMQLFSERGMEENRRFSRMHKDIIVRFGRFPHRNRVLGRESTPEETEFLKNPGSGF